MKRWTYKQFEEDGFSVGYYDGYWINYNTPKNLTQGEHYEYIEQKMKWLNKKFKPKKKAKAP